MKKSVKITVIILSSLIISIASIGRLPQLITITMLSIGTILFIKKYIKDQDAARVIITLFISMFMIKIVISLFMYNSAIDAKYYGFAYKGDDYVFGDFGTIIGGIWRKGIFLTQQDMKYFNLIGGNAVTQAYQIYNAVMFYIFGIKAGQILLILNCFFSVAIIIPVYFICSHLDIRKNITFFVLSLFLSWPSVFYWSLFNFKEPILLFSIFMVFSLLLELQKNYSAKNFICLFIFLAIANVLKLYIMFFSIAVILYLFFRWKWKYKAALIFIFSVIFMINQFFFKPILADLHAEIRRLPEAMNNIRHYTDANGSAYLFNLNSVSWLKIIMYLPFGLLATFALPFFLKPEGISHIIANMETIVWLCLAPFFMGGIFIAAKNNIAKAFPMIALILISFIMLTLTQGNMGTLIKQKAVIYFISFIFVGISIDKVLYKHD